MSKTIQPIRPMLASADKPIPLDLSDEEIFLVNAFRALPPGEPKKFVLRYMMALREKLVVPVRRPSLALVENRIQNDE